MKGRTKGEEMCVRVAAICAVALLLAGCGHREGGGVSASDVAAGALAAVAAADDVVSPPSAAGRAPADTSFPPDRDGNPACPPSDAWGRDVSEGGVLVTVWSDHADVVTVLVRTKSGADQAQTGAIGPRDRLRLFEFPDVDPTAVTGVLILTNTRRCYSMMDPDTAAG